MTDVLGLQTDIAVRVARALKVTLVDEARERLSVGITKNPHALDNYFRGSRLLRGDDPANIAQGIAALDTAITLDPRFARAYAARAAGRVIQIPQLTDAAQREAASGQALADAQRAIEMAPDSGIAHESRAYVLIYASSEPPQAALEELDRARMLEPGDANIQALYAMTVGAWPSRCARGSQSRGGT